MTTEISPSATSATHRGRRRPRLGRAVLTIALIATLAFWIFPFLWMVLGSFKTPAELFSDPPTFIPENPTTENYTRWFTDFGIERFFGNSLIVALATAFGNLLFSSMVGYALAKMQFPGKRLLFGAVMMTLMVPGVVTFVPLFVIMASASLLNTYAALILPFLTMPIGVFLMRQFMFGIPDELIEAARLDGASELTIFGRIVLPLSGPPLATLFILTFLASWNNFLWPLVAAQTQDMYTLPVALSLYSTGNYSTDFGLLMAGAVIVIAPILIIFIFLQRYFIQGIATTGIK